MSEEEVPSEEEQIEPQVAASGEAEQEVEETVETLSSLQASLKKSRWNVFMFLGLAFLMFGFALFPMSMDADFEYGTAEKDLGLGLGSISRWRGFHGCTIRSIGENQSTSVCYR